MAAHEKYLGEQVFRPTGPGGLPLEIDADDDLICPETFQHIDPSSPFLASDRRLDLIRVERLSAIADFAIVPEDRLREAAIEYIGSRGSRGGVELNDLLGRWRKRADIRPTFSASYTDLRDIMELPSGWEDALRDALGLMRLNPADLLADDGIEILVFRYRVGAVPTLSSLHDGTWPLIPPTVLDGRPAAAFCPSPRGLATGHVVDLSGASDPPRREVVHPTVPLEARFLWRMGTIRKPLDFNSLATARALHILSIRKPSGRADYAADTDLDIL